MALTKEVLAPDGPAAVPANAPTVLVVDDEPGIVDSLQKILERESLRVLTAGSGGEALELIRREPVSVLVTDLMMPGMSGIDLLRASRSVSPETETILMTAYGTVENAVDAMKQGAYDFVTKPLKRAHLLRVVGKALEKRSLVQENRSLRAQLAAHKKRTLIGQSLSWRRTMDIVLQAAPSLATVLLLGESGTGKELLARAIHDSSPRAGGPFVPVNCAALPETILEAELFGYEKGAFTGAVQRHDGRFLQANGGTLFLDEIGEIPTHVQVKLLRVLQEGEVERLGGRTNRVDLRLVAATNQDLRAAVREGRFREDLYYRLNVIAVPIPPLRDRRDDIPLLAEHFLSLYAERNGRRLAGFSRAAMEALTRHEWPGNVRELENSVERAVVLCRGSAVELDDLPPEVRSGGAAGGDGRSLTFAVGTPLEEIERRVIHATLAHVGGDKRLCAQLLGIATRTIYRRLEEERPATLDGAGDDAKDVADDAGSAVPNWQAVPVGGSR
ncbi:MAG TPA: sigma-54 dependent transcriptional regulator [Polyangia bacterium]|jgi:two-component system response regulator HydG|nr:sigma-54 dependent transcriptional regulator [Polyangia bacterium]